MSDDVSLLTREGFDLDTAVFFATLSSLAYSDPVAIDARARELGFVSSRFFDAGNVQGYWCAAPDAALLAFRGTSNPGQWLRDARFLPGQHPWGHVHVGFRDGLAAVEAALGEFDAAAATAGHVWIVGHSLGGALALLAAARHKMKFNKPPLVHTYGQPAVGLNDFAERFAAELPGRLWRFVNQSDIVARVPPAPLYRHVGVVKRIVRPGVLESLAPAMEAPAPPLSDHAEVARQVIAGGRALEAARAAAAAGVTRPLMVDLAPPQLTDTEMTQLQLALNAAPGAGVEGLFPFFDDHAISDYIKLLDDIRHAASGQEAA